METKTSKYISPELDMLEMTLEQVLCYSNNIESMEEDNSNTWVWEE